MTDTLEIIGQIQIRGANPYVLISAGQAKVIKANWQKPMPVLVLINDGTDSPWRTNMMPTGSGEFYLYLHGQMRKASGTAVGDIVSLTIYFDEEYKNGPLHPMPKLFREALGVNPAAQTNWQKLAPSRQKEILRYFAGLKSDGAKKRNVVRAIHVLEGNPARFMGREWREGK